MTTKAAQLRFDLLRKLGCICCMKDSLGWRAPEMHHIVGSSYRKHSGGDHDTLPLCAHHHRNEPPGNLRPSEAMQIFGPTLRAHKREFTARYGTERELLAETNALIDGMRA